MAQEKLSIAKDLWTMGIKTLVLDVEQVFIKYLDIKYKLRESFLNLLSLQTLEQIQDYCQEMFVSNIVMLKETKSVILRRLMEDKLVKKFKNIENRN